MNSTVERHSASRAVAPAEQRDNEQPRHRVPRGVLGAVQERARRETAAPNRAAVRAALARAEAGIARIPMLVDEDDPAFRAALQAAFDAVRAERERQELDAALDLVATERLR